MLDTKMKIIYDGSRDPWKYYFDTLGKLIETYAPKRICEIGGGAFPALSLEEIEKKHLDYTVMDISQEELDRAPAGYGKIKADICARDFTVGERFDFIFSKMLAEHVHNGELFHTNVYNLLNPRGIAFHFFPTLFALPFVVNLLIPEPLAIILFNIFVCIDPVKHKKFHSYYHWCRGPTPGQIKNFKRLNYDILEYKGFFGHRYYDKFPILRNIHMVTTKALVRFPNPYLTSHAFVILQKPGKEVGKGRHG